MVPLLKYYRVAPTVGVERRRSQRIPFWAPLIVVGLDPLLDFRGRCNTVEASSHGCQFFSPRPFRRGARLRLTIPDGNRTATAHVVRSLPAWPSVLSIWKIALELDTPGNFWGAESPPQDWVTTA